MADLPADFDDIPKSLRNDLREFFPAEVKSTVAIDQAIQNRARAHLARRRRLNVWQGIAAAAAVIVIGTAVLLPTLYNTDSGPGLHRARMAQRSSQLAGDVNGDSVVDIRDALALQREVETGMRGGIDLNHDGVTDKRDVDAIAMIAVRIDGGAVR